MPVLHIDDAPDVLYVCDAGFSDRAKDPAFLAELRKAKFLIVHSWDANHPLNEIADVLLPSTVHVEKDGTFTNLQNRVQRIHQAYPPKGQAVQDIEIFRRIGAKLYPGDFRSAEVADVFDELVETIPAFQNFNAGSGEALAGSEA